jgi:hypothetical protein
MAEETNNLNIPDFSKQISIESLISAPLVAASKANVVMVKGQTRFLLDYCFTQTGKDPYRPVMIEMVMTRGFVEEDQPESGKEPEKKIRKVELAFSVPLLILVPINSLAVNKVSLEFDLEITAVNSWDYNVDSEPGSKNVINKGAQLYGKISYDHDQNVKESDKSQYKSSMSSKLKVNIDAGPLPLPVGLLSIIDLYNKSIQPLPIDVEPKK